MTLVQLKEACGEYYTGTETKVFEDGTVLYRTLHKRHAPTSKGAIPLGCFKTEEEALQALYNNLVGNGLIKALDGQDPL